MCSPGAPTRRVSSAREGERERDVPSLRGTGERGGCGPGPRAGGFHGASLREGFAEEQDPECAVRGQQAHPELRARARPPARRAPPPQRTSRSVPRLHLLPRLAAPTTAVAPHASAPPRPRAAHGCLRGFCSCGPGCRAELRRATGAFHGGMPARDLPRGGVTCHWRGPGSCVARGHAHACPTEAGAIKR